MDRHSQRSPAPLYRHHRSSDEEFLDLFWTTNIRRPGRGVALLCVKHKGRPLQEAFVSDWKLHAEEHIVNFLRNVWEDKGLYGHLNIEIFQNYSPCGKCARTYCDFFKMLKENGVQFKADIHFVSLYRIFDWVDSPDDINWHLNKFLHWKNINGLQVLAQEGITLKTFTEVTWLELIGRMEVRLYPDFEQYYKHNRENIDSYDKKKLQKVLACSSERVAKGLTSARQNNPFRTDHRQHQYIY